MIVYLFGWIANWFGLAVQGLSGYQGRFFQLLILILLATIAFFRGSVGTDTANYEMIVAGYIDGVLWDGREPGFVILSWILLSIAPNLDFAVRSLSLIFFALLVAFITRADQNERFMLFGYLIPAFAFQYSMNALRIGLASALLLLAAQQFRRSGARSAVGLGILSMLFHYSSAFSLLYIAVSQHPIFRASTLIGVILMIVLLGGIYLSAEAYFAAKFVQYQAFQAPGIMSGLSKVIVLLLLVAGLLFSRLPLADKGRGIFQAIVFTAIGWGVTQFSYAGLRILDLLAFAIALSIFATYGRLKIHFDMSIKIAIVCAGVLSAAATFRGFVIGYGVGESPFLPYELQSFRDLFF